MTKERIFLYLGETGIGKSTLMDCLFKTTFEGRFGVIKCFSVPFKFRGILFSFDGKWFKRVFLLLIFIVVVVEVIGVAIPETIKYCMADRFKCSTWYNRFIHLCVKEHPRVLISFDIAVQVQALWSLWKESLELLHGRIFCAVYCECHDHQVNFRHNCYKRNQPDWKNRPDQNNHYLKHLLILNMLLLIFPLPQNSL